MSKLNYKPETLRKDCEHEETAKASKSVTFESETITHSSARCVYIDLEWCVACKEILDLCVTR